MLANKKYYYSTLDYQKERKKLYKSQNIEKIRDYQKQYSKTHRDKVNKNNRESKRRQRLFLEQLKYYNL